LVADGFEVPPVFMSPHSPPRYLIHAEAAGYRKAKDLVVFDASAREGYTIPDCFERLVEALSRRRPHFSVRRIDMNRLDEKAHAILGILNDGVNRNWGHVPVDEGEMRSIVAKLRLIADPDAIWFVEDDGNPIGCALGFPAVDVSIKRIGGKLLPLCFFILLAGIRKICDYRLWGLAILPEYHGLGLDVLLYESLYHGLEPKGVRLEANYVLEDNFRIVNALEKLGTKRTKRYRAFEKTIEPQ
jgi:GNAT superfamily N-acetyltransferase